MDDLLAEVAEAGWFVNNLFQRDDGIWQANLRRGIEENRWHTEFGFGYTAYEALEETSHRCEATKVEPHIAIKARQQNNTFDLFATLGITKPPIRRV